MKRIAVIFGLLILMSCQKEQVVARIEQPEDNIFIQGWNVDTGRWESFYLPPDGCDCGLQWSRLPPKRIVSSVFNHH